MNADQAADWPRLAEARGSPRHDLTLRGASGEPAGRSLCHLLSTQALQIYVIVSALCTRHPLLMSPVAFAHHLMTGAGMFVSLRPFGHSRTGLFFGVTELSTIPLDVIDLFKGATPSPGRWPQAAISSLACPGCGQGACLLWPPLSALGARLRPLCQVAAPRLQAAAHAVPAYRARQQDYLRALIPRTARGPRDTRQVGPSQP